MGTDRPRYCRGCGAYLGQMGYEGHECPAYREEPPLPLSNPSFRVVPARTPEQLAESLRKVRRAYDDRLRKPCTRVGTRSSHYPKGAWQGRGSVGKRGRWGRYNDPSTLVWVDTVFGRSIALTRNQADIYGAMKLRAGTGIRVTMRELAAELHLAASTIWRAMIRLTALGLIVYQTNRGKYGGTVFRLAEVGDTLDWLRDEAKARLREVVESLAGPRFTHEI